MTTVHNLRMKHDETYALAAEGMTASRRKKAHELAADTLYQLTKKNSKLVPQAGYYVKTPAEAEESLQEVIKKAKVPCGVCALGSLFCSLVLKENKATVADGYNGDFVFSRLSSIFTPFQVAMIERCFERDMISGVDYPKFSNDQRDLIGKAEGLYRYEDDPRQRVIKIMLNILSNDGVFAV